MIRVKPRPAKKSPPKVADRKRAGQGKAVEPPVRKRPLITRQQAIREFGEEVGPRLAQLINSKKQKPTAGSRLYDAVKAWADAEKGVTAHYQAFGAPPQAGPLRVALQQAQAQVAEGRWAILVIPPGPLTQVVLPSRAPAIGCPLAELTAFAQEFRAPAYWGGSSACEEISAHVRYAWSERASSLLEVPIDELLASLWVAAQLRLRGLELPTKPLEDYLRALHAALLVHLPAR
jgi:hypothetical protein